MGTLRTTIITNLHLAVDGGWSDWVDEPDSTCVKSEGSWIKVSRRTCTNPEPRFNGLECPSPKAKVVPCVAGML